MYKRHGKDRTLNIQPMLCLIYRNKKKRTTEKLFSCALQDGLEPTTP